MRNFANFKKKYFDKYSKAAIPFREYDPVMKIIARKHVANIKSVLKSVPVEVLHRGASLFEIGGKGDIDIGIYTTSKNYQKVIGKVSELYFKPQIVGENFVAFYIEEEGFTVEISLMKGREAIVDNALTKYIVEHRELITEYEAIKRQYFYSKREYLIQRNKFFKRIIKDI